MPAHAIPIDIKQKGQLWLLPPYNWSHRKIASKYSGTSIQILVNTLAFERKLARTEVQK